MKKTFVAFVLLCLAPLLHAGPEAWLESGLITPEMISSVKEELGLSSAQEEQMARMAGANLREAEPLNAEMDVAQKDLGRLLRSADTPEKVASAALDRLLKAESAVKHQRLRSLLALRDVLTPDQQEKALRLMPGKQVRRGGEGAEIREKARQLKAALEALKVPPTLAILKRGEAVEALVKKGDLAAAGQALDKLIQDSEMEKMGQTDLPDFSRYPAGETGIPALLQRYETVESAVQNVVSLALIKQLLLAKKALEEAKTQEDAAQVGRILSWAEDVLKPAQ